MFAGPIGVLMCLIPLLILILVAFFVVRRFGPPSWVRNGGRPHGFGPSQETPDDAARRLLSERFAKGDITVEEFLERASALNWYPGGEGDKKS